jgi:hypothetical protein
MHRVQKPQLLVNQEQEDDNRAARNEEVLPPLPQASGAQGNQVE